jgi:predicted metalloprotease
VQKLLVFRIKWTGYVSSSARASTTTFSDAGTPADFFAGVWANHAQQMKNILDPGDIDEALNAANAIGDDRLQKETQDA